MGARASTYWMPRRILLLFSWFFIPPGACEMQWVPRSRRPADSDVPDCRFPHRHKTPDFTTFSSLLRMSTKYQFQEIRSQILLDLLPAYPTELSEYKGSSCLGEAVFGSPPPHPNSVLDLFVTCKVAFALPFAYYRVCIAGDPASLDTSDGETALPPDTLKTALRGQVRLKGEEVQLAKKVAFQDCAVWGACSGKLPAGRTQVYNWIHPEVATQSGILERGDFQGSGYCIQCSQVFRKELSKAKEATWGNLPSYFGLPLWDSTVTVTETNSIAPGYAAIRTATPEQTGEQVGLFDLMTSFDESPGTRTWDPGSPQSTPPTLEQPVVELMGMGYINFPDPDQIHDGVMMYNSVNEIDL